MTTAASSDASPPASDDSPRPRSGLSPKAFAWVCGLIALVVLLIGGYAGHWAFTGFGDNDTLWEWLDLLLLPIAIATLPIWVRHHRYMDRRVRIVLGVLLLMFLVIVVLGYAMQWTWTGFSGQKLWDWLGLILLPFVIVTVRYWSELRPRLLRRHVVVATAFATALTAIIVVGYVRPWEWTGFTGNTLWDWIQLVAVPLLFPLVITPAAVHLISTGVDERRDAAGELAADKGLDDDDEGVKRGPAPAAGPSRIGLATVAAAAAVALVIGGVGGALAFGGDESSSSPSSSSSSASSAPSKAAAAAGPCLASGAQTEAAGGDVRVVRVGSVFYACTQGAARPVVVGKGAAGSGLVAFAVGGQRVAFANEVCGSGGTDCSTLIKIMRLSDGHVFGPHRFKNVGHVAGMAATPNGGVAVMLAQPRQLWTIDKQGAREVASGPGLETDSLAEASGTVYWRSDGSAKSAPLGGCAAC
jgi:hypothetical protein